MARPQFTKDEEALIAYVRIHDASRMDHLVQWLAWVVAASGLFFYGYFRQEEVCVFTGFIIVLYQLCRFIFYQVRPSWRLAPIFEKYEEACRGGGGSSP